MNNLLTPCYNSLCGFCLHHANLLYHRTENQQAKYGILVVSAIALPILAAIDLASDILVFGIVIKSIHTSSQMENPFYYPCQSICLIFASIFFVPKKIIFNELQNIDYSGSNSYLGKAKIQNLFDVKRQLTNYKIALINYRTNSTPKNLECLQKAHSYLFKSVQNKFACHLSDVKARWDNYREELRSFRFRSDKPPIYVISTEEIFKSLKKESKNFIINAEKDSFYLKKNNFSKTERLAYRSLMREIRQQMKEIGECIQQSKTSKEHPLNDSLFNQLLGYHSLFDPRILEDGFNRYDDTDKATFKAINFISKLTLTGPISHASHLLQGSLRYNCHYLTKKIVQTLIRVIGKDGEEEVVNRLNAEIKIYCSDYGTKRLAIKSFVTAFEYLKDESKLKCKQLIKQCLNDKSISDNTYCLRFLHQFIKKTRDVDYCKEILEVLRLNLKALEPRKADYRKNYINLKKLYSHLENYRNKWNGACLEKLDLNLGCRDLSKLILSYC